MPFQINKAYVDYEFKERDLITWVTGRGFRSTAVCIDPNPGDPEKIKVQYRLADTGYDNGTKRILIKKERVVDVSRPTT